MNAQDVHVIRVDIGQRRRTVDRQRVKGLADSINEIGLLNPITVRETGDGYTLVAGRHRLEAVKQLGWAQVPAVIVVLDDVDRMLAEIDENLIRNDLSDLERSEHLAERKRLYLLKHPETKRGGDRGNQHTGGKRQTETISFSQDAAEKIGVTDRSIRQDVQIAESIPADVRDALRDSPVADSKTDLLEMARLPEDAQREIVQTTDLTSKPAVRAAIAEHKPPTRRTPDPEFNQDPGDEAFNDNPEPEYDNQSQDESSDGGLCPECRQRFTGDACPCTVVAVVAAVEPAAPAPPADPDPEPAPAARQEYQPATRTSSAGLGQQPMATPARSGPPPLVMPRTHPADALRAVRENFSIAKIADSLSDAFDSQELRSLVVAGIDALPNDLLPMLAGRINVRIRPAPAADPAAPAVPSTANLADWDESARMCLTPGSRVALIARLVNGLETDVQRRVWEMLRGRFEPTADQQHLLATSKAS